MNISSSLVVILPSDVALVFQSQIIGGCQARNQTDTSQITRKQNLIPPPLLALL